MANPPNLDLRDKLVKRGLLVSWNGYRARVERVRTGRCLLVFVGLYDRGQYARDIAPGSREQKWVHCRSVCVVQP